MFTYVCILVSEEGVDLLTAAGTMYVCEVLYVHS